MRAYLAAVCVLMAGCTQQSLVRFETTDAGPEACPSGQTRCGEACLTLTDDEANCGACGNACAAGQECVSSACQAPCVAGGSCAPADPCHQGIVACVAGAPVCNDTGTARVDGTTCGTNQVCAGGACTSCTQGAACVVANVCKVGTLSCTTGPLCIENNKPNGTVCGTDMVCNSGNCAACTIGTACVPTNVCHTGSQACDSGGPTCTDTGGTAMNGTVCGTDKVCSGGSCNTCIANLPCSPPGNPCHNGTTSCSTGVSVCVDAMTNVMNGITCGTNMVCNAGTCNACTAGTACTPNNVCHNGQTSCASGTSQCMDLMTNVMNGNTCGTNQVCNNGTCNPCTANVACNPPANLCHNGSTACTTGTSVCVDAMTNVMNGDTCGTDMVCLNGTCNMCAASMACTPTNECHVGSSVCSTGALVCTDTNVDAVEGAACTGGACTRGACHANATIAVSVNLSQAAVTLNRTCAEAPNYSVTALTATTAVLDSAPSGDCLVAGDTVLVINLQGAPGKVDNIGNYELLTVATVVANTITFTAAKTKSYGDAAASDADIGVSAGQQRVMLQRVPVFGALTIDAAATVTVDGWNGLKGGVLAFRAASVTLNGKLSAEDKGYRNGDDSLDDIDCDENIATFAGESITGLGIATTSANSGASGGIGAVAMMAFTGHNFVGASAGHASVGQPGQAGAGRTPGTPGEAYGAADGSKLTMGSGVGGIFYCDMGMHAAAQVPSMSTGGSGIVAVWAGTLSVNGEISAKVVGNSNVSGGTVFLRGGTIALGASKVDARGGTATDAAMAFTNSGSDGRVIVLYRDAVTGTALPAATTTQIPGL